MIRGSRQLFANFTRIKHLHEPDWKPNNDISFCNTHTYSTSTLNEKWDTNRYRECTEHKRSYKIEI